MAGDDDVCDLKETPIENAVWFNRLLRPRSCLPQTIGAPASELFAVGVCRDSKYFKQRDTLQIYGSINLYDKHDTCYKLYTRTSDNPETLTPQHNLLSVDMPAHCLISTSWSHMSFSLKDKADDGVILEKKLYFDKLTDINRYNKVQKFVENLVFVTYVTFPAAVLAFPKITLVKTNDTAPAPLNLTGKIIARCLSTYGHKYPGIVLLNTPSNQPIEALSNVPIDLSRGVVVVPAFSFLRIDLQLSQLDPHQQKDITGQADFPAEHLYDKNFDIVTKYFVIRFHVQWCHPYKLMDDAIQPLQLPQFQPPQFQLPKISDVPQRHHFRRKHLPRMRVYSLVEMYAVVIHHDTNRNLKIFGAMEIRDHLCGFLLFDINKLNPLKLSGNEETIPLTVERRCFNVSEYLFMKLRLEDVEGEVLIEGIIDWETHPIKKMMSWYDRHICSVIRGKHGYAEVFYTMFSKAVQAKVRITFECYGGYQDGIYCVDGSVVARHSNGTYLTEHDKKYYQSVLFRGNSSNINSGCSLPLSKSVVAVPSDAFLMVAVDLYARQLSLALPLEHLESDLSFNLGSEIPQIIQRENCCIQVAVEWSDLDKLFDEEIDLFRWGLGF